MPSTYTITGNIYNEFNIPFKGIEVQAFEIDFSTEKSIGKATTYVLGAYIISCSYNTNKVTIAQIKKYKTWTTTMSL